AVLAIVQRRARSTRVSRRYRRPALTTTLTVQRRTDFIVRARSLVAGPCSVPCTLRRLARAIGHLRMHILMIAPEPFFEPRGTPFSEFHRIRALAALGHTVDLVTYPFGADVELPGLRIHRCLRPPFVARVGIGP